MERESLWGGGRARWGSEREREWTWGGKEWLVRERESVCVMVLFVIGQDKWIRSCTTGQTGRSHRSDRYWPSQIQIFVTFVPIFAISYLYHLKVETKFWSILELTISCVLMFKLGLDLISFDNLFSYPNWVTWYLQLHFWFEFNSLHVYAF